MSRRKIFPLDSLTELEYRTFVMALQEKKLAALASDEEITAMYAEMGRKGGRARAKKLSAKRRREIATMGAVARRQKWLKERGNVDE